MNLVSEIACEDPLEQHVSRPYWGNLKLGEKQSFSCAPGYRERGDVAICTRDGWTPKPLCTGMIELWSITIFATHIISII